MNRLFFSLVALGIASVWLRHSVGQLLAGARARREAQRRRRQFRIYTSQAHPHLRVIVRVASHRREAAATEGARWA